MAAFTSADVGFMATALAYPLTGSRVCVCVCAVCAVLSRCAYQPYIAFEDMLLRGPTTTLSPTRSLQSTIKYDMNSHYRFGGVAPQKDRDPMHAILETRLLEFITKEGTPGVMPSEPKLRVRLAVFTTALADSGALE